MLEFYENNTGYLVGRHHLPDENCDGFSPVRACEAEDVTKRRTRGALVIKGENLS